MFATASAVVALIAAAASPAAALPGYGRMADMSRFPELQGRWNHQNGDYDGHLGLRELLERDPPFQWDGTFPGAQPPPAAELDTSLKLIADKDHPYIAPGPLDARGPCPGLNALANHGYLPREGIVTPQQIMTAAQKGFNMQSDLAEFIAYGAHLATGNLETNLISIGRNTTVAETGPFAALPATPWGLNHHGIFEGDASTTRSDNQLGNNHEFNETYFQTLVTAANKTNNGFYNNKAAAETRYQRWLHSKNNNPIFLFTTPRIFTAYGESVFAYRFFVDGRNALNPLVSPNLDMATARSFFQVGRFPDGWYRRLGTTGLDGMTNDVADLYLQKPLSPGVNNGVGNYTRPAGEKGVAGFLCGLYTVAMEEILPTLYPNPQGRLREAVKGNAHYFWAALARTASGLGCAEVRVYNETWNSPDPSR